MAIAVRHIASDPAGVAAAASSNHYFPVGIGPIVSNTTEDYGTVTYKQAGTVKNLRVYVQSGNRSSSTPGLWLRKNGSDTALGVEFAPGGSPVSVPGALTDTSDSISVAADDTLSWHMTGGGSGNSNWTITLIEWDFEASDGSAISHYTVSGSSATTNNTYYLGLAAEGSANTTQANGEALLKIPSGHSIDVIALETYNSSGLAASATISVSGASGAGTAPSITIPGGTTGGVRYSNLSTVAVVDADKVSVKVVTGSGVGGRTFNLFHTTLRSDTGLSFLIAGRTAGTAIGTTNHRVALGGHLLNNATEARVQALLNNVRKVALASVYVSSANAGGTFTLRDDAGDTSLAVATVNPAGWNTDSTHVVNSDATSLYNWNFTRTATPTVHCIVVAVYVTSGSTSASAATAATATGAKGAANLTTASSASSATSTGRKDAQGAAAAISAALAAVIVAAKGALGYVVASATQDVLASGTKGALGAASASADTVTSGAETSSHASIVSESAVHGIVLVGQSGRLGSVVISDVTDLLVGGESQRAGLITLSLVTAASAAGEASSASYDLSGSFYLEVLHSVVASGIKDAYGSVLGSLVSDVQASGDSQRYGSVSEASALVLAILARKSVTGVITEQLSTADIVSGRKGASGNITLSFLSDIALSAYKAGRGAVLVSGVLDATITGSSSRRGSVLVTVPSVVDVDGVASEFHYGMLSLTHITETSASGFLVRQFSAELIPLAIPRARLIKVVENSADAQTRYGPKAVLDD